METSRSVLDRAFSILDVCAQAEDGLTLTKIASACGLPKSSTHRIVGQLLAWGGLERRGDALRLGGHMFVLGSCAPHARRLRETVLPFLQELCDQTRETVHLGVLDGHDVLYVDKLLGRRHRPLEIPTRVGSRTPLVRTGLGKAILATGPDGLLDEVLATGWGPVAPSTTGNVEDLRLEMARIRSVGVAFDHGGSYPGVSCVASPLHGPAHSPPAAISVTAPTERFQADAFARITMLCARGASRALRRG